MSPRSNANADTHNPLIVFLRVVGVLSCTAIVATVMPTSWMVAGNDWMGLDAFPNTPLTQYLARSISALYAALSVLAILVSFDVVRFAPIIRFFGYTSVGLGIILLGVDKAVGMPTDWTLFEGPSTIVLGLVVLLLARRIRDGEWAHEAHGRQ